MGYCQGVDYVVAHALRGAALDAVQGCQLALAL
jgi:hypothetical protein